MEILAILNQKGGSGKTTTAVNLGSALAEKKKRVLLIDVDPQGSASSWLGFRNPSKGLFTLFTENGSITDIVSKTGIDGLDIIQSSPWLIGADRALAGEVGAETILKKRLAGLKRTALGLCAYRLLPNAWDYVLKCFNSGSQGFSAS